MTTHLQSERIEARSEARLSRRGLVQVLAAGAAASVATPASADQSAVVAEATSADYARDPTRWGSPGVWRYHVVLADLRGYGDSSLPDPGPNLINYSFRVMAEDMLEVMDNLGYQRFFLVGHDRGARLSHRMCLDHPDRVMKLCLLDMLPNYYTWTTVNKNRAIGAWHWMFMAQPEPFPETMMSAVPAEWFLRGRGNARNPPKIVFDEYIRCWTNKTITGSCRDYRAFATIDFEMDTADKDRQIGMPLLILWGTRGAPPTQEYPTVWRKYASNLVAGSGRRSLHQILHDVNGEARVFTLRGQAQARSSDYGRR
jgi:haloacetate dehalogenase